MRTRYGHLFSRDRAEKLHRYSRILSDLRFGRSSLLAEIVTISYVERLIAWRGKESGEPVRQLQNILARLRAEVGNRAPKSSSYEISIYSPGLDAGYMSFPCLSYLSLKYDHRLEQIHLTALYRNHTFLSHAYGNFIGLGRLMEFVCRQTGTSPGELVSVSSHADAEIGGRKSHVHRAINEVRAVLQHNDSELDIPESDRQPVTTVSK